VITGWPVGCESLPFLISDRAGQFTASFGAILASVGIQALVDGLTS